MKHIVKVSTQEALDALTSFAQNHGTWDAVCADQSAETRTRYLSIKTALGAEQFCVCCYCESRVTVESDDSHVEHLKPRSRFPQDTFDYQNLSCSCQGGRGTDAHCGHHKGGDYDAALFVSPHNPDIEQLFRYNSEGGVAARDGAHEAQGQWMIQILNLDCPRLNNMRRSHGRGLLETIDALINSGDEDVIDELALTYLIPDGAQNLHPFYSVSRQIFGARGDAVLALFEE